MQTTTYKTHREVMKERMTETREIICRALHISQDKYIHLHYEMAYGWLEYQGYVEGIARFMIISPTFHRWFNQALSCREEAFIQSILRKKRNASIKTYIEFMVTMPVRPNDAVWTLIMAESNGIIRNNPDLKNLKIYNNG